MLEAAQIPTVENNGKCDGLMMEKLLKIIEIAGHNQIGLRSITLELCCIVIRRLLLAQDCDESFHVSIENALKTSQHSLVERLKTPLFTEELFLEMFEDEYYNFEVD